MRQYTIPALDTAIMEQCRLRIDNLTKPLHSLAQLETMAERLSGIFQVVQPRDLVNGVIIFAGDTAVDGMQNKTQGEESYEVLARLNAGMSPTNAVADAMKASLRLVDVGLEKDTSALTRVRQEKVMKGSHFFGKMHAMSHEEVEQAMETGFRMAEEMHEDGVQVVAIGTVGERGMLSALAVTAALTGYPVSELVQDNACSLTAQEKIERLTATLANYDLAGKRPKDVLAAVGNVEIAALMGFVLGAASHRMAITFDNAITGAAVLAAVVENPRAKDYVFPSCAYDEPVHLAQMKYMGLKGFLYYHMNVDEALGSAMGLSLLDASLHMLNDMKTFGDAAVGVAEDGPGNERQNADVKYDS